jgi:hypothetical protein
MDASGRAHTNLLEGTGASDVRDLQQVAGSEHVLVRIDGARENRCRDRRRSARITGFA